MRDSEILEKIESFPRWHYRFNLRGHKTPIYENKMAVRHRNRAMHFFDPMVELFGGSLEGKRVLDLGCNAGWWSLRAITAGADYVLGVDGRRMHVEQSEFVFEVKGIEKDRYDFVEANLFDLDLRKFGEFDIVLCLGLLYHISKPIDLMERIGHVSTDLLIVDTAISPAKRSVFEVRRDSLEEARDAVDYELVLVPSARAVHDLASQFDYRTVTLKPDFRNVKGMPDYRGSNDYRKGLRRAFFCSKQTDLSELPVEIEPLPEAPQSFLREAWRNESFGS